MTQTAKLTDEQLIERYGEKAIQAINKDSLLSDEEIKRESTGRNTLWQPGVSGNPKGRPKGSLNRIQALFYDDLLADWQNHGMEAIERMRIDSPKAYVQVVASILPKALEIETDGTRWVTNANPAGGLSTAEWLAMHGLSNQSHVIESTGDNDSTDT